MSNLNILEDYIKGLDSENIEYDMKIAQTITALMNDTTRLSLQKTTLNTALTASRMVYYVAGVAYHSIDADVLLTNKMYRYAVENLSSESASCLKWFHDELMEGSVFNQQDIDVIID